MQFVLESYYSNSTLLISLSSESKSSSTSPLTPYSARKFISPREIVLLPN